MDRPRTAAPAARPSSRPARGPRARPGVARPGGSRLGATLAQRPWVAPALWLVMFALLGADTFRVGFFADDFHLLDVARRMPFGDLLAGRYGIYPWYRPLSRELYFLLIAHAGALEHFVARLVSLAAVALATWQVRGIARAMGAPREGTIAMLLLLGYGTTRFLAAWSSGFQDLLALALMVTAVREQVRGRALAAAAWAVLATFAKETGVLAFPLIAAHALLLGDAKDRKRAWLLQGAGLAVAVLVHLAVRATWHSGGSQQGEIVRSWPALAMALGRVALGFVPGGTGAEPHAAVLGAVAAAAAALLLVRAGALSVPEAASPARERKRRAWTLFLALGLALGLTPLVVGHATGLGSAYAYYSYAAVPWLALLLARAVARLPEAIATAAVALLVGVNTMTLGFRVPDLTTETAWEFHDWDWPEALRLSAVTRRLSGDLEALLADRPADLVVLFMELPSGCFFQTEDGPATRESLHDPGVRSYWLNATPFLVEPGRFTVLALDHQSWHLKRASFPVDERGQLAASSVAAGEAGPAWVYTLDGDPAENSRFEFSYFRAAAALVAEGPERARRELEATGLADSTGAGPERWADMALDPTNPLRAPLLAMLHHPLSAAAHMGFADACREHGVFISEAVELRIASALDPSLVDARLRLARALFERGKPAAGRRDLAELSRRFAGTDVGRAASALLDSAETAEKAAR